MRLLDTTSFELCSGEQDRFRQEGYAILSHRWVGSEITFDQLKKDVTGLKTGTLNSSQADKVRGACETARNQGISWMWIDTCCIDKSSATEESESINSMFKWYRDARLCITYLADVKRDAEVPITSTKIFKRISNDEPSDWFFRGWTLQELLAPQYMQFFDKDWTYMGTKQEMADTLARITGIKAQYLTGAEHFSEACIAAKMSWMAHRTTTREEDMAYSMIGIFGVSMTPQYGEGRRAFMRLQEQLLTTYLFDESIFAWKMPEPNSGAKHSNRQGDWAPGEWGLLASCPEWFGGCGNIETIAGQTGFRAFVMTPEGLRAPIRRHLYSGKLRALNGGFGFLWITFVGSIPALVGFQYVKYLINKKAKEDFSFVLNCYRRDTSGQKANVAIYLRPTTVDKVGYRKKDAPPHMICKRIRCDELDTKLKPITNFGEGIVLQPRPGFAS
ncbi:hypothetical protein FHL15_011120 [Xylaria flabelliformis]|uniref:Uncharacterized protein n=1 Tax=Xylaria flabelliformis TaxID=2512241 RepID=A0A553HJ48_9PEZI|nr:hypothetical protein FHL15_011120 [Xylaria flabelliformis]